MSFPFNITNPGFILGGQLTSGEADFVTELAALSPSDGDIFVYRTAGGAWTLEAKPAGGANPAINDITDIVITSVTDNEVLAYDNTSGNWINQTAAEAGLATAAQGALADTSVQPGDNISGLTNDSGFITSYTVTEGDVTAHQAALSITESQISDLANYETKAVANGSLTAVLDTFYVCVSNSTFTDPTPTEGKGFTVLVRNGTATVGGTGYGTAGTIIHRIFHSGAWANYEYNVSSTFATAAQGATADTAVQPGDDADTLGSGAATDGWVLTADGAGNAAWEAATGGGIANIVEDTTPQLGGTLDLNSQTITGTITPSADGVYDIGTSSAGYVALYTGNIRSDIVDIETNSGDEITRFETSASPVNYLNVKNSATGNALPVTATGTDTNISINLVPKGTGEVQVSGDKIVTETDTQTLTNKTLTSPTIDSPTFSDVNEVPLDGTPDTDHTANGPVTSTFNAGATLAPGDVVYMGTGGTWLLADADATASAEKLIGIALESKTSGQACKVALPGSFVRDDTWNWTAGDTLYLSLTAGDLQSTVAATATDDVSRVIGYAVSADVIYLQPQQGVVHV